MPRIWMRMVERECKKKGDSIMVEIKNRNAKKDGVGCKKREKEERKKEKISYELVIDMIYECHLLIFIFSV